MIPETQIHMIARQMLEKHGLEAIAQAAQKAVACESKGEAEEAKEWRHIEDAMKIMRAISGRATACNEAQADSWQFSSVYAIASRSRLDTGEAAATAIARPTWRPSMQFAERGGERHAEDLLADIIADVQDPATPIFQVGSCDERTHDNGGVLARLSQIAHGSAASIGQYSLGVGVMEIDLSHVPPPAKSDVQAQRIAAGLAAENPDKPGKGSYGGLCVYCATQRHDFCTIREAYGAT